jgi:hypothetical protein
MRIFGLLAANPLGLCFPARLSVDRDARPVDFSLYGRGKDTDNKMD